MAFLSPLWASLITSCTPESPLSTRSLRKCFQAASLSEEPMDMPSSLPWPLTSPMAVDITRAVL